MNFGGEVELKAKRIPIRTPRHRNRKAKKKRIIDKANWKRENNLKEMLHKSRCQVSYALVQTSDLFSLTKLGLENNRKMRTVLVNQQVRKKSRQTNSRFQYSSATAK